MAELRECDCGITYRVENGEDWCPACVADGATNACEHCAEKAPPQKRFCSEACARCEHESESENGCDGICVSIPGPCAHCSAPATCYGQYESSDNPIERACDTCCGHGNEDGWCKPIEVGNG